MSVLQVQGNSGGTGTIILASPNTNNNYTLTLPAQTGALVSGTSTASAVIPAGTTSTAAILLNSGTNLTSATAGAVEYDGKVIYATPQGTQRGVVPGMQFFRLDSTLAGTNATGAQSLYGVGVTLSASTVYDFEIMFTLQKNAGTTSHTVSILFGGTATLNSIQYQAVGGNGGSLPDSSATSTGRVATNAATATAFTGAITAASSGVYYVIKGVVSINAGGTFIPQYSLSAAPGGAYSTAANSYMKIYPVGASGANTNVGTWA